ncbi:chaplin ChpH [Streptomyces laurentii]|uniref:chaplin ChpH n=1 Tax=Streptomyces laurentii TaxID=39478 RepID=UPI0036C20A67
MIKKVVAAAAATGGLVLAGAGMAVADAGAQGAAIGSPGVVSGNVIQVPIHLPVNVCGNTINVIGLLNPAFGNTCINA